MFDVILIDFSNLSRGPDTQGRRGSLALAFTMGGVAALLAGACVAPVVIQVILFSSSLYAGGTSIALALPFVLGLGMALPWPLAGAGMAWLPKPGAWMVRVKQAMGVLILVTAAYYGYLAYEIFDNRRVDAGAVSRSVQDKLQEGWTSSLSAGLAQAEREGKPVLIDFWATWCKNCLTMDATTFENAGVKAAIDGYVKVKVQAEDPDAEPAQVAADTVQVGRPADVRHRAATTGRYRSCSGVPGAWRTRVPAPEIRDISNFQIAGSRAVAVLWRDDGKPPVRRVGVPACRAPGHPRRPGRVHRGPEGAIR